MKIKNRIKGFLCFGMALFFLFLMCCTCVGSTSSQELPFKFGGEVSLKVPFDPHHLTLKGNFTLFNFNLKGDIDLYVMSTSPLRVKFFSKRLFLKVKDLFTILNKLGYLPNPPSYIKGTCLITGLSGSIEGQNYSLEIQDIKGPFVYGNFFHIHKGNFYLSNKKLLKYCINFLEFGKSSFNHIEGIYSSEEVNIKLKNMNLDIGSLLKILYIIRPDIKQKVLSVLQRYLPVSSFSMYGTTYINSFNLCIAKQNNSRNASVIVLDHLYMNISSPSKLVIAINSKYQKVPMFLSLLPGSTIINLNQDRIILNDHGFRVQGKNLFYPIKIAPIGCKKISIPLFSVKNDFDVFFPLKDNGTSIINIKGSIIPLSFDLYIRKSDYIKLLSSPIYYNMRRDMLNFKLKNINISIPKRLFIDSKSQIGISGNISLKNVLGDISLGKKNNYNITLNLNTKKLNISHPLLSILVKELHSYIGLTSKNIFIKDASANILANKGSIVFSLDTVYPIKQKVDYKSIYSHTNLALDIKKIKIKDTNIEMLKLKKTTSNRMNFQYNIEQGNIEVQSRGYMQKEDKIVNFIISYMRLLDRSSPKETASSKEGHFSVEDIPNTPIRISIPSFIPDFCRHYHLELDKFSYFRKDREYDLEGVKSDVLFKGDIVGVSTELYFCNLFISGGAEIKKGSNLGVTFDIRAISLPVDHLLGCFIREAPVYITGDTNIQVNLFSHGNTYREVGKNFYVDGFLRLDNGRILKLSNLGKKVEMILEVLNFVGLNPSKIEDALPFNKLIVSVSGGLKKLDIKQLEVISPILLFSSAGYFDVEKKKLHLSGTIKKSFLSKDFNLTTFLDNNNKNKGK